MFCILSLRHPWGVLCLLKVMLLVTTQLLLLLLLRLHALGVSIQSVQSVLDGLFPLLTLE